MNAGDTIFALSSGGLPSGVAVVRISGHLAASVGGLLRGGLPVDRNPVVRVLEDETFGVIDRVLVFRMWQPRSFTGEDTVELHLHGGKAVVAACMQALGSLPGFRHAEPGEFSRRAFLNGKVDLYEAEALSDLISAETEAQRRYAATTSLNENRMLWSTWMADLTEARAYLEAEFDFADEDDIPGSLRKTVEVRLQQIVKRMRDELERARCAEIVREGFRVVLTGAPNVGKSSLLNCLSRRDVAIVSEEAGTTRDLIEVALDLGGFKVILTDTAGLRETSGVVEQIGINRAREAIERADLVLCLVSPDQDNPITEFLPSAKQIWTVVNKVDLNRPTGFHHDYLISAKTGFGVDELIKDLTKQVRESSQIDEVNPVLFRDRQIRLCSDAADSLERALAMMDVMPEIAAEEMRAATIAIGRITGAVDVEDMLDVIFSQFCIGK